LKQQDLELEHEENELDEIGFDVEPELGEQQKLLQTILSENEQPSSDEMDDEFDIDDHYKKRREEREKRIRQSRYAARAWAQEVLQANFEEYRAGRATKGQFLEVIYYYLRYQVTNKYSGPLSQDLDVFFSMLSGGEKVPDDAYETITAAWLKLHDRIDNYEPRVNKDGGTILFANWLNVVLLNQGRDNARIRRRDEYRKVGIIPDFSEREPGMLTSDKLSALVDDIVIVPEIEVEVSENAPYTWGDPDIVSSMRRYLNLIKKDDLEKAATMHAIIFTPDVFTETEKINVAELTRRLQSGDFAQIDPANPIRLEVSEKMVRNYLARVKALFVRVIRHILEGREKEKVEMAAKRGIEYVPLNLNDPDVLDRERKRLMKTKPANEFKKHLPTEKKLSGPNVIDPESLELNGRWIHRIPENESGPDE
jgi:hypothetical protein